MGLNYVILRLEDSQPYVGGTQTNRRGAQMPDYLAATSGTVRFTVLVEIKTPDTPLLSGNKKLGAALGAYRTNSPMPSPKPRRTSTDGMSRDQDCPKMLIPMRGRIFLL